MSVEIYSFLEPGPQIFDLDDLRTGFSTYSLQSSNIIHIISFIESSTYVDVTNNGDFKWINNLQNIKLNCIGLGYTNVEIVGIFFKEGSIPDDDTEITPGIDSTGLSLAQGFPNSINFPLLKDNDWNTPGSVTKSYKNGFTPSTFTTTPFTYIIYNDGSNFRVTDKWHLGSNNNGNGGDGSYGLSDLIDLSTGSTYNISNLAHNELFVNRRIEDLLTTPQAAASASPDASSVSDQSEIALTFTGNPGSVVKKIIGAGDSGNFGPAATIESVTGHAQVTLDSYIGSTSEACTINLQALGTIGDGNPYNLTLGAGLTDTAGNLVTFSSGGSYTVDLSLDTTPPRILSVVKNPHLDK